MTALVATLVALRSFVFVFYEGVQFDSDQAQIGLMAKHLIEGRAFPVFLYGQPYMLGVEAWLTAPFVLVGGTTVPMLKLPLALVNIAVAVLLLRALERWGGLRPALAMVPALFFVLAAPGTTAHLVETSGGNVEPFLIVVLLYMTRRRPIIFGGLLAFGVLHREFVVYAAGAFVLLRLLDGSVWRLRNWRPVALSAASFGAVWQAIDLGRQYSSVDGPGTWAGWAQAEAGTNVSRLLDHVCLDPAMVPYGVSTVLTSHFGDVLGAEPRPMVEFGINSLLSQGAGWLWPLVGGSFVFMLGRLVWLMMRRRISPVHRSAEFASYLWLVGFQALAVYALLRCGVISTGTMRYSLLGTFAAVGLTAAYLKLEPSRWLRRAAIAVTLVWAASVGVDHARLAYQYAFDRPVNARRLLADRLVEQGVEVAYGDYWEAHITSYLTNEQVIVASTTVVFLHEYQWIVDRRADEAVEIRREPCPGGTEVVDWLHICPPGT